MSTNKTEHYQLNQWVKSDQVLMDDFNADNRKLDQALKALAEKDAALEALIGGRGNCEMEVLTYTGTGTYGAGSPTRIEFAQKPDVFFIAGDLALVVGHSGTGGPIVACKDATYNGSFVSAASAVWNGDTLSLTNDVHPRYQMNTSGQRYWVLGLRAKG